jgi:hypothetical protein
MKKIVLSFGLCILLLVSCKNESNKETISQTNDIVNYEMFGQKVQIDENILSASDMLAKYESLKEGDTLQLKFKSSIDEVCQKKGCWMNVGLTKDAQAFVKFKDYEFFAPMDAAGYSAVLEGKAFVSIVSVDDLKHYAKDAGKNESEIERITEPEVTYSFIANGIAIETKKGEK